VFPLQNWQTRIGHQVLPIFLNKTTRSRAIANQRKFVTPKSQQLKEIADLSKRGCFSNAGVSQTRGLKKISHLEFGFQIVERLRRGVRNPQPTIQPVVHVEESVWQRQRLVSVVPLP
jgi:hypothetical protein